MVQRAFCFAASFANGFPSLNPLQREMGVPCAAMMPVSRLDAALPGALLTTRVEKEDLWPEIEQV